MSKARQAFGPLGVALLPICCLGVPLLIAAGIGVAAVALYGGIVVGAIACAVVIALLVRRRKQNAPVASTVAESTRRS